MPHFTSREREREREGEGRGEAGKASCAFTLLSSRKLHVVDENDIFSVSE